MIVRSTVLVIIAIILGYIFYSFQTINPYIGLKVLWQISICEGKVEKISDKPLIYISKSYEDFINYIENEGYTIEGHTSEPFGIGIHIIKNEEYKLLTSRNFMGIYEIYSE